MRSIAAGQNVAEKKPTKGIARLGFFGAQNAARRFAYTDLLGDVKSLLYIFFIYFKISILYLVLDLYQI
jgi:hypothetical protein